MGHMSSCALWHANFPVCISLSTFIDEKDSVYDEGQFFTVVLDRSSFTTFMNCSKVKSFICTVAGRVNHISKLIEYFQV